MPVSQGPQVSGMLSSLSTGAIDSLLFRASQKADSFCERRLGAPPTTTLSASVSAGATSIAVTSTLGIDALSEQAVYIDTGGSQELVEIVSGGVTLTPNVGAYCLAPYPGTLTLATPLQYGHLSGVTVQCVYREVSEAGGSSTSDPYTEALLTQTAQLALAHLPPSHMELTRTVFLSAYPIIGTPSLIEHSYSYDVTYETVDISSGLSIVAPEGWYRFRIGAVILKEGLIRTTYQGGYESIPDDIKSAVSLYATLELMRYINPFGLVEERMGKRALRWQPLQGKHALEVEAEQSLKRYRRTI
jgi:hypothetical protein